MLDGLLAPRTRPDPETLRHQVVLEEHDIAPDGSFAVVTRRTVEGDHYVAHCWQVPLDGGGPRQLTHGTVRDKGPAIAPDGRRLAFRRRVPGTVHDYRLLILDLAGDAASEPWEPALDGMSVDELAWSPDGRSIAFAAATGAQRFIVGPVPDPGEPRARRITVLDYRWDEDDYLDRRSQAFIVAAEHGAVPRQVTDVSSGVSGLAWRPDGRAIAFVADPREDADRRPRTSVWEVTVGHPEATPPREILVLAGPVSRPAYSPDGRWIAGVGVDDPDFFDDLSPTLFVGPADGSARALAVAPDLDRPIGNRADTDLTGWMVDARPGPAWDVDGAGLIALVTDRGRTHPWRFRLDATTGGPAGDPVRLARGDVMGQSLAVAAGVVTILATTGTRPPELCVVDADGTVRAVTTLGSAWIDGLDSARDARRRGAGSGRTDRDLDRLACGRRRRPAPDDRRRPRWTAGGMGARAAASRSSCCVARGFRVVLPNIRGSASYGRDWIRPQLGDWGGVDADDVHAALDHVIELGSRGPGAARRAGPLATAGSWSTGWWARRPVRRRRVRERRDQPGLRLGATRTPAPSTPRRRGWVTHSPPRASSSLWRQSPLRNVAAIRTPLLMLQAEADLRCPPRTTSNSSSRCDGSVGG